ncbi:unnamed protein product [Adineta ricciae]|uniref:NHL repeat containing protein-like protein n=1 Tax=Adineta ricciae TaxID=249248 RepID=A0A815QK75_ADIRI|nr:unnamed protein product [Adineta ricciae]
MYVTNLIYRFQILITIAKSINVSYNQPRFSSCAIWDVNASTIITSTPIGSSPYGLFINTNNTIYITSRKKNNAQIWPEGAISSTNISLFSLNASAGIFVTNTKDIYIDNGLYNNVVVMWPYNQMTSRIVMNVSGRCHSLFVDINNTLYCSMGDLHQVARKSLNTSADILPTVIAGSGVSGSAANLLANPYGIFVDTNFDLYVADSSNNRIQVFHRDQPNGTTIVGIGSSNSFALNNPSDVTLDADAYLFIVDKGKNRIIGSGPYGYRCIAGCSEISDSTPDTLSGPFVIAFDSHGNLFVLDANNARVQKFTLKNNSVACIDPTTIQTSTTLEDSTTSVQLTTTHVESTEIVTTAIETSTTSLFNDQSTTVVTVMTS